MAESWWLLSNRHGGVHITRARNATDARRQIREGIAEAGMSEGMSPSAAKRYAHTYNVYAIVGGCTKDEAWEARDAWEADDFGPAEALRRQYGPARHPLTATGPSPRGRLTVPISEPGELLLAGPSTFGDTAKSLAVADRAYAAYRAGAAEVEDATRSLIEHLGLDPLAAWQALNADESPSRTYLAQMDASATRPSDGGA